MISANARNWYLTTILELEGMEIKPQAPQIKSQITGLKRMEDFFKFLVVRVNPEKSDEVEFLAHFCFTDTNEDIFIKVLSLITFSRLTKNYHRILMWFLLFS